MVVTPLFKSSVNRLPALRKVQICPKLAETKRKNIFWTIWTAGFVWAAEDIGYINLTKISPKVPILSYFGIHSLLQEPKYHLISLPHSKSSQKRYKMANICIKCTNWVIFGLILSQNSAYFMLLLWKYCIWYMIHDTPGGTNFGAYHRPPDGHLLSLDHIVCLLFSF